MKYALETLRKERDIVSQCLGRGTWIGFQDAKKVRQKRLDDLDKAIEVLDDKVINVDFQKLFNHMSEAHDLTLTQDEMWQIVNILNK